MDKNADEKLAALTAAAQAAASPDDQVEALCALAREQWMQGMDCALQTVEQAHTLADAQGTPRAQAVSLCTQGYLHLRLSQTPQARTRLEQALALSLEIADPALEAKCRQYLGRAHDAAAEMEAAMAQYLAAQALWGEAADLLGLAGIEDDIGALYHAMNDTPHAVSCFLRAQAQYQAAGDRRGVATSLNNIGNIYLDTGEFEQAIRSYEQCLAMARENGVVSLQIACLGNLSLPYAHLGRTEDAVQACRDAIALARHGSHRAGECGALLNWANACQTSGDYEQAVLLYQEARAIAQEIKSASHDCEACAALGECFLSLERLPEARDVLARAFQTARECQQSAFAIRACRGLSEVCKREGDFAQALAHFQTFHALQQQAQSADMENRTRALLIQMQVEQVQKDADAHRLRSMELAGANAALEHANQTLQEQARLMQAQAEKLERQAAEDALTGLANRRCLEEWLARQFAQARRSGQALTVAMADVDHFKQINDRFGHQVGDEVLIQLAGIFRHVCRASDLAARYGGEEFVLALPDTDTAQAQALCERIRVAVELHPWSRIRASLAVTISVGLSDSLTFADHSRALPNHERLLGLADAQLYSAKHAGRNRVFPSVPPGALLQ